MNTVHNSDWQQGIVIGSEASGVLKHTSVFYEEPTMYSGLTHKDACFPFRKVYNHNKDPREY